MESTQIQKLIEKQKEECDQIEIQLDAFEKEASIEIQEEVEKQFNLNFPIKVKFSLDNTIIGVVRNDSDFWLHEVNIYTSTYSEKLEVKLSWFSTQTTLDNDEYINYCILLGKIADNAKNNGEVINMILHKREEYMKYKEELHYYESRRLLNDLEKQHREAVNNEKNAEVDKLIKVDQVFKCVKGWSPRRNHSFYNGHFYKITKMTAKKLSYKTGWLDEKENLLKWSEFADNSVKIEDFKSLVSGGKLEVA